MLEKYIDKQPLGAYGNFSPRCNENPHHASVSVFPVGRHQLSLAADYYASRGPSPTVQATFADLTYRYTLPTKRKIDLEAQWSNLFDTRQYQYSYVGQFLLTQNTYQLRPAQVLVSVRFSL